MFYSSQSVEELPNYNESLVEKECYNMWLLEREEFLKSMKEFDDFMASLPLLSCATVYALLSLATIPVLLHLAEDNPMLYTLVALQFLLLVISAIYSVPKWMKVIKTLKFRRRRRHQSDTCWIQPSLISDLQPQHELANDFAAEPVSVTGQSLNLSRRDNGEAEFLREPETELQLHPAKNGGIKSRCSLKSFGKDVLDSNLIKETEV